MRYLYAFAATVLAAALIFAFFPSSEDAAVYDDILRLHVIAASDSEVDQATKLAVRDALLEKTAPILAGCTSRDEAAERLGEASALLERTAAEVVASRRRRLWRDRAAGGGTLPHPHLCGGSTAGRRISISSGRAGRRRRAKLVCVLFPSPLPVGRHGRDEAEAILH